MTPRELEEPFGPEYPELGPSVAKHRHRAKDGVGKMAPAIRRAYGEAVEQAIKAKQRQEFIRASCEPSRRANCASGTWHSDGNKIDAAIRQQHRAALAAYPSQERRRRTPQQWQELYEEAMRAKRNGKDAAPKTKNRRRK
jgi:hypothetical protein